MQPDRCRQSYAIQSSTSAATNQDTNRKPLQSEEGLHTGQPANTPERAVSKSSDASSPALRCAKACLERRIACGRNCSQVGTAFFYQGTWRVVQERERLLGFLKASRIQLFISFCSARIQASPS